MIASVFVLTFALLAPPPADWQQSEVIWAHGEPFGCGHGDCTQAIYMLKGRVRLIWGGYEDIWQSQVRFGRLTPAGAQHFAARPALPNVPPISAADDFIVPVVTVQSTRNTETKRVQFPAKAVPAPLGQFVKDMRVVETVMRGCVPHAWVVPDCAKTPKPKSK